MFGKADTAPVDLDAVAAGTGGFKIIGEAAGDEAGFSVASITDLNGDGLSEILVGATGNDAGGFDAGAAYVVFGKADTAPVDLDAVAAGTGGFKIIGEAAGDLAGTAVAAVGELTGNELGEVLVGAPGSVGGAGAADVVFF